MIRFDRVTNEDFLSLSFEIGPGMACKIITPSDQSKKTLLDTLLTLQKPQAGTVTLLTHDLYSLPEEEAIRLFTRIGVVWKYGGGLSHLKAWENITLPIWYHKRIRPEEVEDRVIDILTRSGKNVAELASFMSRNTGSLPIQEKRLIALVRALLMEPDLMIYDSLFDGLDEETAGAWAQVTTRFQTEKPERTSVYIDSKEKSLDLVGADLVLRPQARGLINEDYQAN
jgi:phospholipid/cholesterol/gamma-HCH transport system ATP-binding protein